MTLKEFYESIGGGYYDAMERMTDENFIYKYIMKFSGLDELNTMINAIDAEDWVTAFRTCHSLKGMVGNMGFKSLFSVTYELCEILRPCVKPNVSIDSYVKKMSDEIEKINNNKLLIEQQ